MRFIDLTYTDNTKTWVNVSHIVAFERNRDTTSVVLLTLGTVEVKETPVQILAKFP